jgi:ElaB/YqjD/DUF883 family membrane-anchored ribosome-binding protein
MQSTGMQGSAQGAARDYATDVAESAGAGVDHVTDTAHHAMERISGIASRAAGRIPSTEELYALQERTLESARLYIREHPLMVIGIALALGIVLSRLTSRR